MTTTALEKTRMIRDAIVASIVHELERKANAKTQRKATDDERSAFYIAAHERFSRIAENATNIDADALFTRHMYTCSACDKTARASHRDYANAMTALVTYSRVTSDDVMRSFDYCVTCMFDDCVDCTRDDAEKAIVLAIAEHEHIATLYDTTCEDKHASSLTD